MPRHEVLGERLARFERRRRLRRPDDGAAVGREHVDDSSTERKLRPDDREIDRLTSGDIQQIERVADIGIEAPRHGGDSRISRGAKDSA